MAVKHTQTPSKQKLKQFIGALKTKQVLAGYLEDKKYPDGTPVAQIAAEQEYGSAVAKVPPRPTLAPAMAKAKKELANAFLMGAKTALNTQNTNAPFDTVGLIAQSRVREEIKQLIDPPLKESTLAARASRHSKGKASDKPLVDTRVMIRSVEYEVRDK